MNWNTPLLQANTGDLYAVDNNLASFDLHFVESSNVQLIAVSASLKEMLVMFKNGGKYIYKNVTPEVMNGIIAPGVESIGTYMSQKVKGFFSYEKVDWSITKASLTDIAKNYRNMQYTLNINIGNMVTDRADLCPAQLVETVFWKMQFTEQPDNAQRIA